jgi:hypothetical protein
LPTIKVRTLFAALFLDEQVITILPKGLILWSAHCRDEQAQTEFEHTHLHLANGGDSEMIPANAFREIKMIGKKPEKKE